MQQDREFHFREEDFRFIRTLVYDKAGIVLAEHKRDMVYSRLVRRLRGLNLASFSEYCDLLTSEQGDQEMGNFVNAITTNLSSFFREPHHFDHLAQSVLKPLISGGRLPEKRIRIWSAACSWGAEPYSIAMTLANALNGASGWDAKVLATDIDTNMLTKARNGEFDMDQMEKISEPYRRSYCTVKDKQFVVKDAIRSLITFKPLNLLEGWPFKGMFDAVFCRNVVIYFDKPTQARLFDRIADVMKPDGWLYIGHSENLFKVTNRFQLVGKTIYRKVA